MKKNLLKILALIGVTTMVLGCSAKPEEAKESKVDYDIIFKNNGLYDTKEDGLIVTKLSKNEDSDYWKQIYTLSGGNFGITDWGNIARYKDTKEMTEMVGKIRIALNSIKFESDADYRNNGEVKILIFRDNYIEDMPYGGVSYWDEETSQVPDPSCYGFWLFDPIYRHSWHGIEDGNSCLVYVCRKGEDPIIELFGGYRYVNLDYPILEKNK